MGESNSLHTSSVDESVRRARWYVLAASLAIVFIVTGPRLSYSIFIEPLTADLGWSRTLVVLPFAILVLLTGLFQPVVGRFVDSYGPRVVILISVVIGCLALVATSFVTQPWQMVALFSVVFSMAVAGTGPIPLMVLLAPWFSERQRAKVFGVLYALLPISVFFFAPVVFVVISSWGWRVAFMILGLFFLGSIPLVVMGLRERNPHSRKGGENILKGFLARMVGDGKIAFSLRPFLYVSLAYFTCGFTAIFFIGQIAAIATSYGFVPEVGVTAAALTGIASGVGTIACGVLADRYPRAIVLSGTYLIRAVGFILLVTLVAHNMFVFYGVVILIGLVLFGTAPSTNALVYEMFRGRDAGMLLGLVFVLHQVGGFLGMFLGGLTFDLFGNYAFMFWLASGLMVFATILSAQAGRLLL